MKRQKHQTPRNTRDTRMHHFCKEMRGKTDPAPHQSELSTKPGFTRNPTKTRGLGHSKTDCMILKRKSGKNEPNAIERGLARLSRRSGGGGGIEGAAAVLGVLYMHIYCVDMNTFVVPAVAAGAPNSGKYVRLSSVCGCRLSSNSQVEELANIKTRDAFAVCVSCLAPV